MWDWDSLRTVSGPSQDWDGTFVGTKGINTSHHYLKDQKEKLGMKQWMAIDEKKFYGPGLKNNFGPWQNG